MNKWLEGRKVNLLIKKKEKEGRSEGRKKGGMGKTKR